MATATAALATPPSNNFFICMCLLFLSGHGTLPRLGLV
jgi:hypothetical protein